MKDSEGQTIAVRESNQSKSYVLNFYATEVQVHLTKVFATLLHKWKIDRVQLEGLQHLASQAPPHKARGQVISEALQFLQQLIGVEKMTVADAPLLFALQNAQRVTLRASLFSDQLFRQAGVRQHWWQRLLGRRSTRPTVGLLLQLLHQWSILRKRTQLTANAIFIEEMRTDEEDQLQQTQIILYGLLLEACRLCFPTSQDADFQLMQWDKLRYWQSMRLQEINNKGNLQFQLLYEKDGKAYTAYCNLMGKLATQYHHKQAIELEAYETLALSN